VTKQFSHYILDNMYLTKD